MEVDFIQDFIIEQIQGQKLTEIKTLTFREGGVELSPGNIVKCIIPEWLKDQTVEVSIVGGKATIKSNYGEYTADVSLTPETHNAEITIDGVTYNGTIKDTDPSHTLTLTFKDKLKDGDSVFVGKFSGIAKYIILSKAEKNNA